MAMRNSLALVEAHVAALLLNEQDIVSVARVARNPLTWLQRPMVGTVPIERADTPRPLVRLHDGTMLPLGDFLRREHPLTNTKED